MSQEPSVAENASASRWNVEDRAWKQDLPDLPDEVIALLATPVVVTASALAGEPPLRPFEPVTRAVAALPIRPVAVPFRAPVAPRRAAVRRHRITRPRPAARIS
jgi:hypothetical protein